MTTHGEKISYIVYIIETQQNGSSYSRTKKLCQTLAETEQAQKLLIEQTGKFHEIREA